MSTNTNSQPSPARRRFLAALAGSAAALGLSGSANRLSARDAQDSTLEGDAWMKSLKGKHRQFFHAMTMSEDPLRMASNFLEAYREAFAARDGEVNAVIGMHGSALYLGFNDDLWKKYEFGKAANINDPATAAPAVRNIFGRGAPLTVEALQARGVLFLACNTALRKRAHAMSEALGVPYDALYAELSEGRIPGVILVPAMVVAVNRAQEAGFSYLRAS